jgi:hypothetical protein
VFLAAGLPLAAHEHAGTGPVIEPEDLKESHPGNPDSEDAP